MATKLEDALRKVTSLPGVKAAFVFDQFNTIVARDVPGQYSNDILKRIASQLYQLALFSWKTKVLTQEFRLVYDKYAVYTRLFAKSFYLVVFMEKHLEPADFRQPLNLSVLVLDRALRSEDVFESTRAMAKVAQMAENSLKESHEFDDSFAGQFRRLCVTFLGQTGRDLVDLAMEEQYLFPPLHTEEDMRKLRDFALSHIVHPLKREIIRKESREMMQKSLNMHTCSRQVTATSGPTIESMRTDYHMHTTLCGHATGAPRDYVLAAQRAGLVEIGFSDHNPMPTQFDDWRMAPGPASAICGG